MTNREPESGEVYTDAAGITREVELVYRWVDPNTREIKYQVQYMVRTAIKSGSCRIRFTCSVDEWQARTENAKRVSVGVTG